MIIMASPCLPQDIISKCSNSCIPGEFKKTTEGQHTCCYECMNCTENYFSNSTGKTPVCMQWMRQPQIILMLKINYILLHSELRFRSSLKSLGGALQ